MYNLNLKIIMSFGRENREVSVLKALNMKFAKKQGIIGGV